VTIILLGIVLYLVLVVLTVRLFSINAERPPRAAVVEAARRGLRQRDGQ
jgi:hypothetical protein